MSDISNIIKADGYNKFDLLDNIEISILRYLFDNNDDVFRLITHNESNALDLNITEQDKRNAMPPMTANGFNENTRLFLTPYLTDAIEDEQCQLRVYVSSVRPQNRVLADVLIGFDVMCHNDIVQLDNYLTRHKKLMREVLFTLNGAIIDSLGELSFIEDNSSTLIRFNDEYSGYRFTMKGTTG